MVIVLRSFDYVIQLCLVSFSHLNFSATTELDIDYDNAPLSHLNYDILKKMNLQVVLSCIEGSPAARAGIHQGDELVEINGTDQVSESFLICEAI